MITRTDKRLYFLGRAPFFMFTTAKRATSVLSTTDAASSQGGAGIKAAQSLVDSKAGALLTPRCGDNAAEVLKAAGVGLYKTRDGSAADNIRAFLAGELQLLTDSHPAFTTTGEPEMKIAVLSGKGGTGKTLLSVNLAAAAGEAVYVDCESKSRTAVFFLNRTI
jgi:predicted Fe-Mo cluster-binding NifX family protein